MNSFQKTARRLSALRQRTFHVPDGREPAFADSILECSGDVSAVELLLARRLSECDLVERLKETPNLNAHVMDTFDPRNTSALRVEGSESMREVLVATFLVHVDSICFLLPSDVKIYFDQDEFATVFARKPALVSRLTDSLASKGISPAAGYRREWG